jgi:hypothetical protein
MNKKTITRMGLNYSPPTLRIEYRNGQNRGKCHSHNIRIKKYLDQYASGHPYMTPVERSMEVKAIADALVDDYDELQQVPFKALQGMIEKLHSYHTQNISVTDTRVGDEERDEQSTFDDLDNTLDRYLDDCPLDCGIAREVDYSSNEDTLVSAHDVFVSLS